MSYFKKTSTFKQIFFSKATIVIVFFLIIFTGFGLFSIIGKSITASHERKISENEISDLKTKEADLSKKIEMLKTPEGQDQALKEQYPVVSPGEHVIVITDDAGTGSSQTGQTTTVQKKGFWDYLKNLFAK